jgi:hypothetical protein
MPVYKYRDVREMPDAAWRPAGAPALFRAIRGTWDLAHRTTRPRFPPGVYKHRSASAAEVLRAQWEEENFKAFHARRRRRASLGER